MLKKGFISLICLLLCMLLLMPAVFAEEKKTQSVDLTPNAQSAVLMDADTGTVIVDKNKDAKLPPASITKIMTMLLIMEAIDQGKIKMDEKVRASEYAASMGGSQIFLEPGEEMTVQEMLKGIAMASGNDASVAMAEKIAGSEENFVHMMNERAQQLGMKNTHFSNSNGLPVDNHYTTASDIAIMSRELLKHEEITKFTGVYQDYLRKDTANPFWLVNTNKLVRFYSGADGLKTGYTSEAKFCLAATAKRENLRVIAVVLGEPNTKTRNAEVSKLFDFAFAQYSNYPLFKSGDSLGSFTINKGEVSTVPLVAKQNYSILMKKGEATQNIRHELQVDPNLKAPVALGQSIGKIVVYNGDAVLAEYPLESPVAVNKASWWKLFKRTTSNLFHTDS
ncbi:D-alanyl-D-alanine carboxypeptidase family protein [Paenibacillus sedimenti]|uniref:serine-type D-Ala-D-Ala carboxypeptidase n=1 Tax=Paenibacillus sedimenti TaxID=2770274 RepID=A0A926KPQ0_9BACL|nr:D-alanyl-D-alanine carboxypeptidase [Paenibacillus sedimenti]